MTPTPFRIEPDQGPLPAPVETLLDDANHRLDKYFIARSPDEPCGFYPSDYERVFRGLQTLRREYPKGGKLLEWGSGMGVVAGMAALCDFDAHGIEIDEELVQISYDFLDLHTLDATIVLGSFVPAGYEDTEGLQEFDGATILDVPDAYEAGGFEIADFDVVFAYPWPNEEPWMVRMFQAYARDGALLLTFNSRGCHGYRQVAEAAASRRT